MVVLDASVLVEWLLRGRLHPAIEDRLAASGSLHAPQLVVIEVLQVLRRETRRGRLSPVRGQEAIEDLGDVDLELHGHDLLVPSIWRLREILTAYDATYVALAEVLGATLLTLDVRLAGSPGHHVEVEILR